MGWEDLIGSECKVIFILRADYGDSLLFEQVLVREYQISDVFGRPLSLWRDSTSFFDLEAGLVWERTVLTEDYPEIISPGDTFCRYMGGELFDEWTSTDTYAHYKTMQESLFDPGIAYAGFAGVGGRYRSRLIWYKRGVSSDVPADDTEVSSSHPDYCSPQSLFGRSYFYGQARKGLSGSVWSYYLSLSSYNSEWRSSLLWAYLHAYEGCGYDPSFAFQELHREYPGESLVFRESVHGMEHPGLSSYPGTNPLSHPQYGGYCEFLDTDPPGYSGFRIEISIPESSWDSSGGGGLEQLVMRGTEIFVEGSLTGGVPLSCLTGLGFLHFLRKRS